MLCIDTNALVINLYLLYENYDSKKKNDSKVKNDSKNDSINYGNQHFAAKLPQMDSHFLSSSK